MTDLDRDPRGIMPFDVALDLANQRLQTVDKDLVLKPVVIPDGYGDNYHALAVQVSGGEVLLVFDSQATHDPQHCRVGTVTLTHDNPDGRVKIFNEDAAIILERGQRVINQALPGRVEQLARDAKQYARQTPRP